MIWWQNTDPTATCSIQGSLTLGLEEAVEENHHPNAGSLIVKEHKFAEMSTWQQELYKYKYEYKYFKIVLEYKYKYQVCIWGFNNIYH